MLKKLIEERIGEKSGLKCLEKNRINLVYLLIL